MKFSEKAQERPVLAIDLGGTKIIAALISSDGQMIARQYNLAQAYEGPESVIGRMFTAADTLLNKENLSPSELNSISIAAAGVIDLETGVITLSPSLPGWHDIPLRDIFRDKYNINILLNNDANAAALGEYHYGAGKGTKNMIYVTVSTGIGGGIILDGKLYSGSSGGAGEIGHTTVAPDGPQCNCGNTGCLEAVASGLSIAGEAKRRLSQGENSSLIKMMKGKIENITAEEVALAAEQGDSLSLDVIGRAADYLGIAVANLVNIFNPDVIVIGGGLAKMGELLFGPVRQVVKERGLRLLTEAVRIVPPELGDDAGVFGAAIFAFRQRD